jgi:hypothetical protein
VLDLNGGNNHVCELQCIPDVTSTNWVGLTSYLMRTALWCSREACLGGTSSTSPQFQVQRSRMADACGGRGGLVRLVLAMSGGFVSRRPEANRRLPRSGPPPAPRMRIAVGDRPRSSKHAAVRAH